MVQNVHVKYLVFTACLCSQLFCCVSLCQCSNPIASEREQHVTGLIQPWCLHDHRHALICLFCEPMSEKFVHREPILGGSKLNMTKPEQAANCYMQFNHLSQHTAGFVTVYCLTGQVNEPNLMHTVDILLSSHQKYRQVSYTNRLQPFLQPGQLLWLHAHELSFALNQCSLTLVWIMEAGLVQAHPQLATPTKLHNNKMNKQ